MVVVQVALDIIISVEDMEDIMAIRSSSSSRVTVNLVDMQAVDGDAVAVGVAARTACIRHRLLAFDALML